MTRPLSILLAPVGSAGDVHPFVGLGRELRRRGHRVTLITSGAFRGLAEREGMPFVEVGTAEQFNEVTRHPDVWRSSPRSVRVIFSMAARFIRPGYERIVERIEPGRTVVVAAPLAFGARVAQDKLGVPTVTVQLAPSAFPSSERPPRLPMLPWLGRVPRFVRRAVWRAIDTLVDRFAAPQINALRRELGLPPTRRIYSSWWNSPTLTIAMFPDWFGSPATDWPPQVRLTGFPLYDERGLATVDPQVETFLDAGPPPVVFTPGSANVQARSFFEAAVAACRKSGRRGILLTRHAEQVPEDLPASVRHVDYLPLSEVLPRSAALVYHGGIGTLSQACAAGVPHVVMPMAYDQFDNAARLEGLGIGTTLPVRRFTPRRVDAALDTLLSSHDVAARCAEVARRFDGAGGITASCDLIEAEAEQGS